MKTEYLVAGSWHTVAPRRPQDPEMSLRLHLEDQPPLQVSHYLLMLIAVHIKEQILKRLKKLGQNTLINVVKGTSSDLLLVEWEDQTSEEFQTAGQPAVDTLLLS